MARPVRPPAATSPTAAGPAALRLKVTLQDIEPPVWRRLVVPEHLTLGELHVAIQIVMGWDDSHLHGFRIPATPRGNPRRGTAVEDEEEDEITLRELVASGVTRLSYTYDFGDSWEHAIVVERARPAPGPVSRPTCIAGARNCPPEDCGGPWGYRELLDILADPSHPDHEERMDWVGGAFDPEAFDLAAADAALAAQF